MPNPQLTRAWRVPFVAVALAVLLASCTAADDVTLGSLNLDVIADVQAGSTFELAVPATPNTTLRVDSAPAGVHATITDGPNDTIVLTIRAAADAPRGAYNLGLNGERDGTAFELGFPFSVLAPEPEAPVDTTQPSEVEATLEVTTPLPGDVFPSESLIAGISSSEFVGYRLFAGDELVAQGSLETSLGEFEVRLGFVNDCCTEMLLEVFHTNDDGLLVSIPLTYPESG